MNRRTVAACAIVFVLGLGIGSFFSIRGVVAQGAPQGENDWVITTSPLGGYHAYIFNTRTGEAFKVEDANKTPVKLKQ
jgi:hypothetical protein